MLTQAEHFMGWLITIGWRPATILWVGSLLQIMTTGPATILWVGSRLQIMKTKPKSFRYLHMQVVTD